MPNPIKILVVAGVALKKDGKYLLIQEDRPDVYGKWNWPAGKVEEGSSLEETAVREAKEETGYDVKVGEEIGVFHESTSDDACKHLFHGEITGGELDFSKDGKLDAKWFTPEEIIAMKDQCRNSWVWKGVEVLNKINCL